MKSKILYSLLAVFAATCLFSSMAKDRLHKLVIDSEEIFYEYPDIFRFGPSSSSFIGQPVVNDIDSITFDVANQKMRIFSSTPRGSSVISATYNLKSLNGFSFSYFEDGKMPSTMIGYTPVTENSGFLTWRPVEGASGYEIALAKESYYTKAYPFDWVNHSTTRHITVSADSTEYKLEHLMYGSTYRAAVKVLSSEGKAYDSEWSFRYSLQGYTAINDIVLNFSTSGCPIWNFTEGILELKEAVGTSVTLNIKPAETIDSIGFDPVALGIASDGKYIFDKIRVVTWPGEKELFTDVSSADIAAGQISLNLPEGYSRYDISAYNSDLPPCDAAYGCLFYKPDFLERGFMLLGTDGTTDNTVVGMLSMKTDCDTVMIDKALTFDGMFHKPRKLYYSGTYPVSSGGEALWIFGEEESWKLSSIDEKDCPSFQPLGTFSSLVPIGTINQPVHVDDEEQAVDIFPKRAPGGVNLYRSVSLAMTDKACYGPEMTISGNGFFNQPVNRMANSSTSPLFNFYPAVFYNGSLSYMSWMSTPFFIYDTDNDRFVKITVTGLYGTHCQTLPDYSYAAWRWDCGSENRKLVYGETTSTPEKGYNYFVMKSTVNDDDYCIYSLQIANANTQTKEKFDVDLSIAKDFDKASRYCFIGCRRAVFYTVGSVLHQYDFERGLHTEMDLGAEITMIKPEYYSAADRHDDLMVATWDQSAGQGEFMKFKIGSDTHEVEMNIRNDFDDAKYLEKWTTRIKIVDAEWFTR